MKNIMVGLLLIIAIAASQAQQYGWKVIARPSPVRSLEAVEFVDLLHGWCGGQDSIFRTTDGGFSWARCVQPYPPNHFRSISFVDLLTGWAVGVYGGPDAYIWHTADGGRSWQQQLYSYHYKFEGTAAQSLLRSVIVGWTSPAPDTAKIFTTTDGGSNWREQTFEMNTAYTRVVFVDSLHGFVTSDNRYILKTADGGVSWEKMPRNFAGSAFTFLDTLHGWAVDGGIFYRTRDGGLTWDSMFAVPNPSHNFTAEKLSFVDTLNGWAFGGAVYQGTITEAIFASTDGGATWLRESIGLTDDLGTLHDGKMLDTHHGWAVAYDGRVLSYQPVTNVVEKLTDIPRGYSLRQNYPNPFNPTTTIEYELPKQGHVILSIYNALGEDVSTLVNQVQHPGVYRVRFEGTDLSTGLYFYTLKTEEFSETHQMLYVK